MFLHWVSAFRPPDSLLQLAFPSWLVARKPQCKVFSDPVQAQDPSKSSVSFCPVPHDPVPFMIRNDVLAATADVREAWGERCHHHGEAQCLDVDMWKTGMLVKELPCYHSSGSWTAPETQNTKIGWISAKVDLWHFSDLFPVKFFTPD